MTMTTINQKKTSADSHSDELVIAIKAVFAATHQREMTQREQAELILPGCQSPFSIGSVSCASPLDLQQDDLASKNVLQDRPD